MSEYFFSDCRVIDPLRDIGRGDLDPLGRGGGGMLFNPPFNHPNILQPRGPYRNPLPGITDYILTTESNISFCFCNRKREKNVESKLIACFSQVLSQVHDSIHLVQ